MSFRRPCLAIAIILFSASFLHAQPAPPLDPFAKGSTTIEFGAGAFDEAWNLNERREWMIDGNASVWWSFANRFAVGGEFQHSRVFQRSPNAFVQGLSPLIRYAPIRRRNWQLFVEAGPGISWSDLEVPPRGTKFNYLFQSSAGVMRRVGANVHALASLRFVHLSNHFREGRDRNPDLEMLGAYGALAISF